MSLWPEPGTWRKIGSGTMSENPTVVEQGRCLRTKKVALPECVTLPGIYSGP